jgi:5-methylcytosine-specific restriction enzyme A
MPWKAISHSERQRKANSKIRNAAYDRTRGIEHKLRKSGSYQAFRAWYKRKHPLCADPFGDHKRDGVVVGMDQLHHVQQVKDAPHLLCDENNCMSLCTSCHARMSARERAQ